MLADVLEPRKRAEALSLVSTAEVEFGTLLMEEGDEDPTLVAVEEGELSIRLGGLELATVGAGAVLGLEQVLGDAPRPYTVKAVRPVKLLLVDRDAWKALETRENPLLWQLEASALATACTLLRELDARVAAVASGSRAPLTPPQGFVRQLARAVGLAPEVSASGEDVVAALRRSRLFAGQPDRVLASLASKLEAERIADGHVVAREGEAPDRVRLLVDGDVEVLVGAADGFASLGRLEAGTPIGLTAAITRRPHAASVVTRGPATALAIDADAWREEAARPDAVGSALRRAGALGLGELLVRTYALLAQIDGDLRRQVRESIDPLYAGQRRVLGRVSRKEAR